MEDKEILEELRAIRKALEPKPAPAAPVGFKAEFLDFISKYKVMGLAVAFILGIYLGSVIQALVGDFLMPIIELVVPGGSWETMEVSIFRVGHFAGAFLTFMIVCLVVFIIVKVTKKAGIE